MKLIECKNSHNIYMVMKENQDVSDQKIVPNSGGAGLCEKHVPHSSVEGDKVRVFVNHVMEEDHYIEWIMVEYENRQVIQYFNPGEEASMTVDYEGAKQVYAFCNKHGLWKNDLRSVGVALFWV